ncbi:uncharacterized protein LOC135120759 [Zophobas morio]|uniref:uncharacterized protein LOC135120759 n=1 Tax=Zophobas morio TaxID=2755281 RepID=UPI003082B67A
MFKSDIHMQKVRKKLIKERETIELSQKLRKQRELKQFAKAVQQKTLERRAQEKKATLNAISKFRKERKQVFDNNVDFDVAVEKERKNQLKNLQFGEKRKSNKKRLRKNQIYGFGGPKKRIKKNDAKSTWDDAAFSTKRNRMPFSAVNRKKKTIKKVNMRPGKKRRLQMRRKVKR